MDDYVVSVLSNIGMISFLALSAYLLLLIGEISFGQQAFFAISAYLSGIATAMWGWPLWSGLLWGALAAAAAASVIGVLTLRLRGLYFSIATLAFAEMVRLVFVIFHYQVVIDGEPVGPDGAEGFRDIRWVFENNVSPTEYMVIIYIVLFIVLALFFLLERSRLGSIFRMLGEDTLLAEMQGLNVIRFKVLASGIAGFIAGIGGAFYAHFATYLEPQIFNVMLGIHGLVYGLIGGLGTALGPLLGVALDIGFLEAVRAIQGYRMIVFGGLVAVLLIFMPRGILDEERIHWFRLTWRRWRDAAR
jgi:branched-chain amino acid transport system permease protein